MVILSLHRASLQRDLFSPFNGSVDGGIHAAIRHANRRPLFPVSRGDLAAPTPRFLRLESPHCPRRCAAVAVDKLFSQAGVARFVAFRSPPPTNRIRKHGLPTLGGIFQSPAGMEYQTKWQCGIRCLSEFIF